MSHLGWCDNCSGGEGEQKIDVIDAGTDWPIYDAKPDESKSTLQPTEDVKK